MTTYKHTQIGYLMIVVMFIVLALLMWFHFSALAELPSADSGTNLFVSTIMILVLLILSSFITLTVSVNDENLNLKFGYGLIRKNFKISEIASVVHVKNSWYYGWGIRLWLSPYMWIYNVSGFDAVQITLKNGRVYRIGTDDPINLEEAIKNF